VIAITATRAAADIPEAGLVTRLIVLNAVGLPLDLIGPVLPIDWLLGRFRTAVNALGDSVGAAIVDIRRRGLAGFVWPSFVRTGTGGSPSFSNKASPIFTRGWHFGTHFLGYTERV